MKTLCFLLFTSLCASTFSKPYDLSGSFRFTGSINTLFTKRYEPVYAFTQAGRERLQVLRSEGWSCEIKPRQTYLCSKDNVASQIPVTISDRAYSKYSTYEVNFEERDVEPVIINQASSLTEYRVHKEVTLNGVVYPYFDYLIIHGPSYDLHKVKWGKGLGRVEFLVESEDFLKKVNMFTDQEKKFYDIFVMEGFFR